LYFFRVLAINTIKMTFKKWSANFTPKITTEQFSIAYLMNTRVSTIKKIFIFIFKIIKKY